MTDQRGARSNRGEKEELVSSKKLRGSLGPGLASLTPVPPHPEG
jgi:hypothetical protein